MNLITGSRGFKLAVVLFVSLICAPGLAASESEPTQGRPPLQGGVVKVQTGLDDLRDARLAVSRVRKSIANLYDEVTREQMTMTYNPNLVGTSVITVPVPVRTGMTLPARPKWVHASMNEIRPIINLFKEDVDVAVESNRQVDASKQTKEALEPIRTEAFSAVKQSFEIFQQLESLTAGSTFDNGAIASSAKSLDQQMKDLDRSLKKGVSILQKEAKAAKKATNAGA